MPAGKDSLNVATPGICMRYVERQKCRLLQPHLNISRQVDCPVLVYSAEISPKRPFIWLVDMALHSAVVVLLALAQRPCWFPASGFTHSHHAHSSRLSVFCSICQRGIFYSFPKPYRVYVTETNSCLSPNSFSPSQITECCLLE